MSDQGEAHARHETCHRARRRAREPMGASVSKRPCRCRCRRIGPKADGGIGSDGATRGSGRVARAEDEARTSVGGSPSASAISRRGRREPRGADGCATRSAESWLRETRVNGFQVSQERNEEIGDTAQGVLVNALSRTETVSTLGPRPRSVLAHTHASSIRFHRKRASSSTTVANDAFIRDPSFAPS